MANPNIELPRRVLTAVTAAGALTPGAHQPVDATSGTIAMTLPAAASTNARAHLSVEKVDTGSNTVTITGSIRGASGTTITLYYANESIEFRADENGSWWPQASHRSKTSISVQIAAEAPAAGAAAGKGASFWHSTTQAIPAATVTQVPLGNTYFNDDTSYYSLPTSNGNPTGDVLVAKAGLYLITVFADCAGDGTAGTRDVVLSVSGTSVSEVSGYTSGAEIRLAAGRAVRLAAGATLRLNAYFSTAASMLGAGGKDTGISIAYLGS